MDVTYMRAPKNTSSATIEGHEYDVPKDGVIEVKNPNHPEVLKRHGFTEVDPPAKDLAGFIDDMDDKGELITFIEEHGGEADDAMGIKKLKRLAREAAGVEE